MPFVTNSIPERVYLWCACRSMRLSARLFTVFSPCSVLDVISISIFAIKCTLKLNICNIMQFFFLVIKICGEMKQYFILLNAIIYPVISRLPDEFRMLLNGRKV